MAMAAASFFRLFISFSVVTLSLASVNIDCGTSSGSGIDEYNINWVGDKDFITSGKSATVSSMAEEKILTTLRYFPTGDSNCYSKIPVKKGDKVLVRTLFYYGNYDGKSFPPKFEVLFDGKHSGGVVISSAFDSYILELMYIPVNEEINVCFVRTSSGSNPFVSSIEVVDLDSGLYKGLGPGEGFFSHGRFAFGMEGFIRSDRHGRVWYSYGPTTSYTILESTAASIDTSSASNEPPEDVLRNSWNDDIIQISFPSLPSEGVPVFLSMYFSEPLDILRSFDIFFGGKQVNKGPVVPEFGKTTQVVVKDLVVSSRSKLVFRSTPGSIVLINALEIYVISGGTNEGQGGGGSGESGGGGSGGSGGSGKGGTGGRKVGKVMKKGGKLVIIIGAVCAAAFVIIVYAILALFIGKRRKALDMPNSTISSASDPPSS